MTLAFPKGWIRKGLETLNLFPRLRVLVCGDVVVDENLVGITERVSREAPVLILRYSHTTFMPGGAGNALNNAADLGAKTAFLSVCGDDDAGRRLRAYFSEKGVDLNGFFSVPGRVTPVKTRVLAGGLHTAKQQVIRIDRVEEKEISRGLEKKVLARLEDLAARADALLVSDYELGFLTPAVRRALLNAFEGKPIVVDSRFRLLEWKGASVVTPNVAEAGPAAGIDIQDELSLEKAGRKLQELLQCKVLITRGPQGMALFDENGMCLLPVFGADQPVDPTGAGDTVAATLALALAAGADFTIAASLAAAAAGLVVAKRGTATVSRKELKEALEKASSGK